MKKIFSLLLLSLVLISCSGNGGGGEDPKDVDNEPVQNFNILDFKINIDSNNLVTFTIEVTSEEGLSNSNTIGKSFIDAVRPFDDGYAIWKCDAGYTVWCGDQARFSDINLISGDEYHGTYEVTINLLNTGCAGKWIINRIVLIDKTGDSEYFYCEELEDKGFPYFFTINPIPSDVTPPELLYFEMNPDTSIDLVGGDESVLVSVILEDTESGLKDSYPVAFDVAVVEQWPGYPAYSGSKFRVGSTLDRVGGDSVQGTYEATFIVSQCADWRVPIGEGVVQLCIGDKSGNYLCYTSNCWGDNICTDDYRSLDLMGYDAVVNVCYNGKCSNPPQEVQVPCP